MKFNIITKHNTDLYDLRFSGLYYKTVTVHGEKEWNKAPQSFSVIKHILLGRGVYKNRKIVYER